MNCEFCNKTFKNSKNLKEHQKGAGYCLKLRGISLICEYCEEEYKNKSKLYTHMETCITKRKILELNEKIDDLKSEIKDLKTENKFLRKNKKRLKLVPFPNQGELIKLIDEHFNINKHFLEGQDGFISFFTKFILLDPYRKLRYICSDHSRKIFKINIDGKINKDIKARYLAGCFDYVMRIKALECRDKINENPEYYNFDLSSYDDIEKLGKAICFYFDIPKNMNLILNSLVKECDFHLKNN